MKSRRAAVTAVVLGMLLGPGPLRAQESDSLPPDSIRALKDQVENLREKILEQSTILRSIEGWSEKGAGVRVEGLDVVFTSPDSTAWVRDRAAPADHITMTRPVELTAEWDTYMLWSGWNVLHLEARVRPDTTARRGVALQMVGQPETDNIVAGLVPDGERAQPAVGVRIELRNVRLLKHQPSTDSSR